MRIGGTEMNAVRTAERLDRRRFHVTVACFQVDGPLTSRYEAAGIEVVPFPIRNFFGPAALQQGLRFARFVTVGGIDIVHSHDMYSNVFAAPWARLARRCVVISSRRWWHTLPNARLRMGNTVAFRMSHCVLANSAAVASSVRSTDRVPPLRIAVVANFADEQAFEPTSARAITELRAELGIPAGALAIGIVARLVEVKDHASLLTAIATLRTRHPSVRLVLIGDGPCQEPLRAQATRLGIADAVTFAGERVGHTNNIHQLFDVSVLCSLSEGFPNALVEAMAAGVPVVATAVGGNVDAVVDGVTGFLVPSRSPAQLASALAQLAEDRALRQRMGAAGRERARREFSEERVLASLESLYERLVRRPAA